MADHLASIFGTEKDRVNCPFYFKIGACRHGDRCSRLHNRPTISPTVLLQNAYQNPILNAPLGPDGQPVAVDSRRVQEFYEDFYEDLFEELALHGEVEYLNVCDNLADHMVGNAYAKFRDEEAAARAVAALQGRYYAGKPLTVEFSPVTDFRESTCRQYEEGTCGRGGYCNFMHLRPVSRDLRRQLFGRYGESGSGGSTRFHDRPRDGFGERGRGGFDDRGRRGRGGYGGGGGYGGYDRPPPRRDSSAERRANIARWNSEARAGGGGGEPAYGNGAPAAAAAQPAAYGAPAPQQQAYGAPPAQQQQSYGAPPPQQQQAYGGPPPQQQQAYGAPPAQLAYGAPQPPSYGGAPPSHAGYGAPPSHASYGALPSHGGYQPRGGPQHRRGGGGPGASGANTAPIANMRTFPYQQQ